MIGRKGRLASASRPRRATGISRSVLPAFAALLMLVGVLVAPSVASASFTRPFLGRVTETGSGHRVGELTAVAGEAAGSGLLLGEGAMVEEAGKEVLRSKIFTFEPSGVLRRQVTLAGEGEEPEAIAEAAGSETLYVLQRKPLFGGAVLRSFDGGTGALVGEESELFDCGKQCAVAVDDSSDPLDTGSGSVYVAHENTNVPAAGGNGVLPGVEKFSAGVVPESFSAVESYVGGVDHNAILGTPSGAFVPVGVAVGPEGDLFVLVKGEVDRFAPSGVFVESFDGHEAPALKPGNTAPLGEAESIAVDGTRGGVVDVAVNDFFEDKGAVDEFSLSGQFLKQTSGTPGVACGTRAGVVLGERLCSATGVAVDGGGHLYVLDAASSDTEQRSVDVFGPGADSAVGGGCGCE